MRFSAEKNNIIEGILKAASILPAKAGAAYLRSIWLKAENDALSVMTTDANIEFTGTYKAQVEEPGLVGVPARSFADLVRQLPSGELRVSADTDGSSLTLKQGKRTYKLPVNGPEWFQEFSEYPDGEVALWSGDVLQEILERVMFCIDDEDTKEATACVCFKATQKDTFEVCGLNGHQFAMVTVTEPGVWGLLQKGDLLIQRKYLSDIKKWLNGGEIELNLSEKRLYLKSVDGAETLSVPRARYQYPDYNVFLSKMDGDNLSRLTISRKDSIDSLGRILVFNTESDRCVFMNLDPGELRLSSQGGEGSAQETLDALYEGSITKIAFPTKNLMEIFGHFSSDKIHLAFTGEEGPCGVRGDDETYPYIVIIMPMKVSDQSYYPEEN